MPLIIEVMAKFLNENRMILFWAINKAFYVFTDLLCHVCDDVKRNIRESLQITLHPPVRKPCSHYGTSYKCTDSSAVYKKWGEQPSKQLS
jgi:hypothetical protein